MTKKTSGFYSRTFSEDELLHMMMVTDDRAGISSELYRLRGIKEVSDSTKALLAFRQKVALGAR